MENNQVLHSTIYSEMCETVALEIVDCRASDQKVASSNSTSAKLLPLDT